MFKSQLLKYSLKKYKHLKPIPKPTFQIFPPTTFPPFDPLLYVLQRILQAFNSPSICPPKRCFKSMYLLTSTFYSQPFHPHLIYCLVTSSNTGYQLGNPLFVKSSQYIRIKNTLHKHLKNPTVQCFNTLKKSTIDKKGSYVLLQAIIRL